MKKIVQKVKNLFSIKPSDRADKHDIDSKTKEAAQYVSEHFGRAITKLSER